MELNIFLGRTPRMKVCSDEIGQFLLAHIAAKLPGGKAKLRPHDEGFSGVPEFSACELY